MRASVAQLRGELEAAARAVADGGQEPLPALALARARRPGQGDYATNAAMVLAGAARLAPRELAARLGAELDERLQALRRWEVAGPGFLNLELSDDWHRDALRGVLEAGERFGAGGAARPERIILEFVSANPTAPLVVASGRHAAYGDALARILAHHGHSVWREYYFNDAGRQIRLLGESVILRARGEQVPAGEGYYEGEYVAELAARIPSAARPDADPDEVAAEAVRLLLGEIVATLERYGVRYDRFFLERTLHEGHPSAVQRAIAQLEQAGHVYRAEGATWLRSSAFGDEQDRVIIRSNGEPTYLASDIAYLQDKRERGFERQLLPLGSDHHDYVPRLKAVMAALGGDPETVEAPILQFVHLVSDEGTFKMSKRRGTFVTLDELLDAVGVDATRFFLLQRSHERTIELNVELARRQSAENPVYYVQYAHARIASMIRRLPSGRLEESVADGADWHQGELHRSERALIQKLLSWPEEVAEAAERRTPHRISAYALELAQDFTAFYHDCRVVGVEPEPLESFRIALSRASQETIALALSLLGVSAPESM